MIIIKLDVQELLNSEDKTFEFDWMIPVLKDYFITQTVTMNKDFRVKGSVSNQHGVLFLKAKISGDYSVLCGRCLKPIVKAFEFDMNESFVKETDGENSEHEVLSGSFIELDRVVAENVLLSLGFKYLCSDDCKGLCLTCGVDLNTSDCKCDNSNWDERFDLLKDLFKN